MINDEISLKFYGLQLFCSLIANHYSPISEQINNLRNLSSKKHSPDPSHLSAPSHLSDTSDKSDKSAPSHLSDKSDLSDTRRISAEG